MFHRAAATFIDCVVDLQNYVNQQLMLNTQGSGQSICISTAWCICKTATKYRWELNTAKSREALIYWVSASRIYSAKSLSTRYHVPICLADNGFLQLLLEQHRAEVAGVEHWARDKIIIPFMSLLGRANFCGSRRVTRRRCLYLN